MNHIPVVRNIIFKSKRQKEEFELNSLCDQNIITEFASRIFDSILLYLKLRINMTLEYKPHVLLFLLLPTGKSLKK